ncbi:MAG TPA: hypothetical protein ENO24_07630 [Chloroflexi bacterium]|nr:hypothetical protein [Chloroflexota bacterium]
MMAELVLGAPMIAELVLGGPVVAELVLGYPGRVSRWFADWGFRSPCLARQTTAEPVLDGREGGGAITG